MERWTMSGAPDLRQALREKAAGHSSFYRKLRVAAEASMAAAEPPSSNQYTCLMTPQRTSCREDEKRCPDRPKSRDSAVDLDEAPNPSDNEEKTCYDSGGENAFDESSFSPYDKREYCEEHNCYHIRSKMILEAQYEEALPFTEEKACEETDVFEGSSAMRRPSTFSWDGDEASRVRKVRTPSVVVSDYSDDIHTGITVEELEYFRSHIEDGSPSSGRSSCSNLDSRCGSQLSVLDLEDSRCGSHLSVLDLDDSKAISPPISDCEDDDCEKPPPKKIDEKPQ